MAAVPQVDAGVPQLRAMQASDLDAVLALEAAVYDFPWSRGNFADALTSGYFAQVLIEPGQALSGYCVAMAGVDEMHVLNITVAPSVQGRGLALRLLDAVVDAACRQPAELLWLEVRPSNDRALALYQRYGFSQAGWRRAYYPARTADGKPTREDAIVMSAEIEMLARQRGLPCALQSGAGR